MFAMICSALDPTSGWQACRLTEFSRNFALHSPNSNHRWNHKSRAHLDSESSQARPHLFDFSMLVQEGVDAVAAPISSDAIEGTEEWLAVNYTEIYAKTVEHLRELDSLTGVLEWLRWDALTFMPPGANAARRAQEAALAGIIHEKAIDKEFGRMLRTLKAAPDGELTEIQRAVVQIEHKKYAMSDLLPLELVQHIAEVRANAYSAWVEYNRTQNFTEFADILQEMVDLSITYASLLEPDSHPYDVLLQAYEKGINGSRLQQIFDEVHPGLVALGAELENSSYWPDARWLGGSYDIDLQTMISRNVSADMGFDLERGRLDVVNSNPFTVCYDPMDVRITTCLHPLDLTGGLTSTIHETGHALYEQGRNVSPEWRGLSISKSLSTAVHESQSLLWERMVSRGKPFQEYLLPKLQDAFPETFKNKTAQDLYEARNHCECEEIPFILCMSIMYKVEKGLLEGSIKAIDIPEVWDRYHDEMRQELCMEEHRTAQYMWSPSTVPMTWCLGAFGYLPTYALGAMYACQIFQTARLKIPDLDDAIARGDFTGLKSFLNNEIHILGSLPDTTDDLLERVTGSKFDPTLFVAHLREKYSEIYLRDPPAGFLEDAENSQLNVFDEYDEYDEYEEYFNWHYGDNQEESAEDYHSAIEASENDGQWEQALSLFDEMRHAGFGLDVIVSNVDVTVHS